MDEKSFFSFPTWVLSGNLNPFFRAINSGVHLFGFSAQWLDKSACRQRSLQPVQRMCMYVCVVGWRLRPPVGGGGSQASRCRCENNNGKGHTTRTPAPNAAFLERPNTRPTLRHFLVPVFLVLTAVRCITLSVEKHHILSVNNIDRGHLKLVSIFEAGDPLPFTVSWALNMVNSFKAELQYILLFFNRFVTKSNWFQFLNGTGFASGSCFYIGTWSWTPVNAFTAVF